MDPGIKIIISGESLETKTPDEFNTLIGELTLTGLNVKVQRTREALKAERQASYRSEVPEFDPELKAQLGQMPMPEFLEIMAKRGLQKNYGGRLWNALRDYSTRVDHFADRDENLKDIKPITVNNEAYDGEPRRQPQKWESFYLHIGRIRDDQAEDMYAIDLWALADALENGYLDKWARNLGAVAKHDLQGMKQQIL
jgi:hypothetical protein